MANKLYFEVLNRTLKDILRGRYENSGDKSFMGLTVVCGGDFRQILPVIPKGTRSDIFYAALNSSHLWPFYSIYELKENICLSRGKLTGIEASKISRFDKWLLKVREGSNYDVTNKDMIFPLNHLAILLDRLLLRYIHCYCKSTTTWNTRKKGKSSQLKMKWCMS